MDRGAYHRRGNRHATSIVGHASGAIADIADYEADTLVLVGDAIQDLAMTLEVARVVDGLCQERVCAG